MDLDLTDDQAQEPEKILLLTRTTRFEDCAPQRRLVQRAVHRRPAGAGGGPGRGQGFRYILDGLNPERMLIAAELVLCKATSRYDRGLPCGREANRHSARRRHGHRGPRRRRHRRDRAGLAHLRGCPLPDRPRRLAAIAAPQHRGALLRGST
ncbi:hypothetical protein ACVGOW_14690 [Pseudonocardia saturnea]